MEFLVEGLISVIGYGTGQVLLFVFTLGKRKPRWADDDGDSFAAQELLLHGTTWLGYLFWLVIIVAIIALTRG